MSAAQAPKLPAATRRRGIYLAYANGALWAIGDGMVTTGLVVYLALDLGAKGIAISLILAAAPLVGSLRLVAPELIRRIGSRHRFAAGAYAVAVIFLLLLPRLAEPGRLPLAAGIAALVGCWAAYHLAEYLGTVALWSYLGDLAPRPIRGRFIGYRERWINACRIPAMLAAGLFVYV